MEMKKDEEKRILVVDDEQDILLLLQLILSQAGSKVDPFDNPLKALSSFSPINQVCRQQAL